MSKFEFSETRAMVNLLTRGKPLLSPKDIRESIWRIWKKDVSLQAIYEVLNIDLKEDFEMESNKLEYYGGTNNFI